MSDHLDLRMDELESLIKTHVLTPAEQTMDKSGKFMQWIQSIIALIVVVIGMGVTWGLTQGKISTLEMEIDSMKEIIKTERIITKGERGSLRTNLIALQVKQASVDQLLQSIREDVTEIKGDVKTLTGGR